MVLPMFWEIIIITCEVKQCCNYHDIQAITPNGKTFRLINLPFYYVGMIDKVIDNEA